MRSVCLRLCVVSFSLLAAAFLSLSPRSGYGQSSGGSGTDSIGANGGYQTGFYDGQNAALQNARGPAQAQAATTIPPPDSSSSSGSGC